jgi:hypothetical protein
MDKINKIEIETRSAPALLGAAHRAFTFYLENPISSIENSLGSGLARRYPSRLYLLSRKSHFPRF